MIIWLYIASVCTVNPWVLLVQAPLAVIKLQLIAFFPAFVALHLPTSHLIWTLFQSQGGMTMWRAFLKVFKAENSLKAIAVMVAERDPMCPIQSRIVWIAIFQHVLVLFCMAGKSWAWVEHAAVYSIWHSIELLHWRACLNRRACDRAED